MLSSSIFGQDWRNGRQKKSQSAAPFNTCGKLRA